MLFLFIIIVLILILFFKKRNTKVNILKMQPEDGRQLDYLLQSGNPLNVQGVLKHLYLMAHLLEVQCSLAEATCAAYVTVGVAVSNPNNTNGAIYAAYKEVVQEAKKIYHASGENEDFGFLYPHIGVCLSSAQAKNNVQKTFLDYAIAINYEDKPYHNEIIKEIDGYSYGKILMAILKEAALGNRDGKKTKLSLTEMLKTIDTTNFFNL